MPSFEPKPDHELQRLSDEELIAYIGDARDHPDLEAASRGVGILVYGHWRNVERRVRMKVPTEEVEDLTGKIVVGAIQAAFDGTSVGEFVNWLATITRRRIADFHRKREKQPDIVSLDARDDERGPGPEPEGTSEEGYVELQNAIERVLARLSERDREVIELRIFQDLPSRKVAEQLELTVANVDQVVSRFRRKLRVELAGGDGDTST